MTSSAEGIVRPKTNAFGESSPLTQILGVGTPAWRAVSSTVRYTHGFVSAVIGRRPRIAHRTMKGEISHWKKMNRTAKPTTIASAPGNAFVCIAEYVIARVSG